MQADSVTNIATLAIGSGLFVLALIYMLAVRGYTRPVPFSFASQIIIMAVQIISLGAYLVITQITANSILVLTAGFAGLVLGILLFGTRKVFVYKGHVEIKRSALPGILLMLAYLSSAYFNIFGSENLMSLGAIMVVLATGVTIGSVVADNVKGINLERNIKRYSITNEESGEAEGPEKTKAQTRLPI